MILSFLKRYYKLSLFQVCCSLLSVILGIVIGLNQEINLMKDKFWDNTYLCGIDVSNKTMNEAIELISTDYLTPLLSKELDVYLDTQSFKVPLHMLLNSTDLEAKTKEALAYPQTLSTSAQYTLLLQNKPIHYNISLSFDPNAIYTFAENIAETLANTSQDATLRIMAPLSTNTSPTIELGNHITGISIDTKGLSDALYTLLESGSELSLDLKPFVTLEHPSITSDTLKTVDTLISTSITNFDSKATRAINIQLASKAIDGILLMPGDIFSFNDTVGETTKEKGYVEAPIIDSGKSALGIGGGVCQVSSTLYNAVLQSGLGSVSRRPHSKPVSYLPLGLDATISFGSIDYKFENTFEYPIYIQSYTSNNQLIINIFSNKSLGSINYKLKSETVKVLPSPIEYIPNNQSSSSTQKLIQSGHKGYQVKVTRDTYQGDTFIGSELVSIDTYKPLPTIYKLN